MELVIFIFISVVILMCLISIPVLIVDMVCTLKKDKKNNIQEKVEIVKPCVEANQNKDAVIINKNVQQSLDEKYLQLDEQNKKYYDGIVLRAATKEGTKHIKNTRYEEYKYGNNRIVRIEIKRSIIMVDLFFVNSDVKDLMSDSNVKVKQASTTIKVIDDSSYELVLESIDMVYNQILQEIERKKALKKEKRKAENNSKNS